MKRVLRLSLSIVLSVFCLCACERYDREHTLKIYNWADYIDEDLLDEFVDWYEEQTGERIKIIYQLFDINEVMLSKIEMGHDDYDVICPSDYIIERMLSKNLLLPISRDFADTPDYISANVSPFVKSLFDRIDAPDGVNANDYAVGYMWGTTGLLYNENFVSADELTSWGCLANPRFEGKIFVKDAFRDVYSSLIVYCRHNELESGEVTMDELNHDASDESIALVEEYIKSFKNNIAGWEQDFGKEQMTKEKAWINLSWSGDAEWSIEEAASVGVPLNYTVPEDGQIAWFDGWCIPKYAVNVRAASYFINFLCMPENAIRNMDEIGYVSVITGDEILEAMQDEDAFEPVDASYFFGENATSVCLNPVMYPDRSVVEQCGLMHDSGDRTQALIEMWSRVKGDNANGFTYILIVICTLALLYGGIRKKVRKYRKKNRLGKRYKHITKQWSKKVN